MLRLRATTKLDCGVVLQLRCLFHFSFETAQHEMETELCMLEFSNLEEKLFDRNCWSGALGRRDGIVYLQGGLVGTSIQ